VQGCQRTEHRNRNKAKHTLKRYLLVRRLGREEPQELGELAPVLGILVNSEFQVLAERLVELLEIVLVLGDLTEEIHALLDDVLSNNLENFVLLKGLTGNVKREVLGVDDTLDEVKVFGDDVLAVVHDEDATDVKFDVIAFLLRFEEVKGRAVNSTLIISERQEPK
jgi:hypothetical protein